MIFFPIQPILDPWIHQYSSIKILSSKSIIGLAGYDLFERDERRGMEDVKLRPVGTLACRVRRTRASSQANIYRVASRPFARDSGACKKEFHSRNEVKIVRLRFLYINDSPPLDWHHPTFVSTGNERASDEFFLFLLVSFFFLKERMDREIFENLRNCFQI